MCSRQKRRFRISEQRTIVNKSRATSEVYKVDDRRRVDLSDFCERQVLGRASISDQHIRATAPLTPDRRFRNSRISLLLLGHDLHAFLITAFLANDCRWPHAASCTKRVYAESGVVDAKQIT